MNKSDARISALEFVESHVNEMVNWLCKSIEFRSISGLNVAGNELEIQEWIRNEFEKWGIFHKMDYWYVDLERRRPNLVGIIKGNRADFERKLIYNGHVDVVPVPEQERVRWDSDPWKGIVKDGRVCGRGASDMKGGLTAAIWAARALVESGIELKNDLIVEAVMGEEQACGIGSIAAVQRGYTAPFAVVAESTDLEIKVATVGNFDFRLVVTGKEVHTGMRDRILYPQRHGIATGSEVGVDAIEKMIKFVLAFRELEKQWAFRWRHELFDEPSSNTGLGAYTINVTRILGGDYQGAVAGRCEIAGEVYYPAWVKGEEIMAEMKSMVDHVSFLDDWLRGNPPGLEAPQTFHQPGYEISTQHEGCKTLAEAFTEANGVKPKFAAFQTSGDWNFIGNMGIPVVAFGPDFQGAHGLNESVSIDAVVRACKALAVMAIDWCDVV